MTEDQKSELNGQDAIALARKWDIELKLAERTDKDWIERAKKIVKRYRDERNGTYEAAKKYNILWSNVETILPAVYAKTPQAEAVRRNKDADAPARCAAEILERALQYEIEQYNDYDEALRAAVKDRLLGGRGTVWVRFETEEITTADGKTIPHNCTPVDYVYWEDFRCSPARVWEEVTWVARRVYMGRDEGVKRFGDAFKEVPLCHVPIGLDQLKDQGASQGETEAMKKAKVWEIWDKATKTVIWVAEGYSKALDRRSDPYGLDGFWPCPKPLYATQTSDTLVPVPDYALYQDQAKELDLLTTRISQLVEALKVVGVYDASQTGVQRMLSEGVNNTLIPVQNWVHFAEKNGIKGVVDWLPLDQVVKALSEAYIAREQCKQVIYEITGISDIIRGATEASETATAQNIKRQFGSLRLRPRQRDVAMFASEVLRIKAQLMADLYTPEELVQISGIQNTPDNPNVEGALELLKTEPIRAYRIEVASDSLIELDEEQEKQSRTEFLTAAGGFLQQALPMVEQIPQSAQLVGEMLMFGVRAYKAGRPLEAAFEQFIQQMSRPQPQGPSPEEMKVQADAQLQQQQMQMDAQIEAAKVQSEQAIQQARMQADMQVQQMKIQTQAQLEQARAEMQTAVDRMRHESEMAHKAALAQQEMAFNRWKAELDAATKIETANIAAKAKVDNEATKAATGEIAREVKP